MATRPFVATVLVLVALTLTASVFAKSKAWNTAFNACTTKMENAYADCLSMPYNSVGMCQNVANTAYKQCMRSKGFSTLEVPPVGKGSGTKLPVQGATAAPVHKKPIAGASIVPLQTMSTSTSSPTPTPKSSGATLRKQHKP